MRQRKAADRTTEDAMDWFIRLQDKPGDRETGEAFARWRSAAMAHHEAFRRIERLMAMPSLQEASRRDAARLGPGARSRAWMAYAASVAAVLFIAIACFQAPALLLRWQADHLTAAGEQKTITLPDGSLLQLNTASAVTLDFAEGRRRVDLLAGEAFFDVRPDPAHPFTVTARFSTTTVKGTAFAVRVESGEDVILLARGRVAVNRLAAPADVVELAPGHAVTADAASISQAVSLDPATALAWREGRVVFREAAFAEALEELDRYYDGKIVVTASRLATTRVSGSYRIDEPGIAISTLAAAVGASETRLPGGLIILY